MKIELKNIKHFFELSKDSNAFSAKLYVNGIFTAECSDDGNGGSTNIDVVKGKESLLEAAEKYVESFPAPPTEYDFELDMDLELFIGQLLDADILEKEFKKSVKN